MADTRVVEHRSTTNIDDEHERTFQSFVLFTAVAVMHAANVLIGLGIGGVLDQWVVGAIIVFLATFAVIYSLVTRTTRVSVIILVLSLVTLLLLGVAQA